MEIIGTRDSEAAKEHRGSQVGNQDADLRAFPGLDVLDSGNPFSYGMTQVDHFDREDATSHLSQPSLVYLGTELGCFVIQVQQLPLVYEDDDTRLSAFSACGRLHIGKS